MSPRVIRLLLWSLLVGFVAGLVAAIAGFGVGYLSAARPDLAERIARMEIVGFGVVGLIAAGAGLWLSVRWMAAIDEAAREAHKSAWFWGGAGALLLGMPLMMIAGLPQTAEWTLPAWFHGRNDPVAHAALGAGGLLALMLVGYTLAWGVWWLRRR